MKPAEVVDIIKKCGAAFGIPQAYGSMTRAQIQALADETLMQPAEVVHHIDELGAAFAIPKAYGNMTRDQIQALAEEYAALSVNRRIDAAMDRLDWAPQRRKEWEEQEAAAKAAKAAQEAARLSRIAQREAGSPLQPPEPQARKLQAGEPQPGESRAGEPQTLVDRAIRRQARLSTPARRRAAFLRHLSRCRTVVEAAARTGVDGRTVRRWRRDIPAFAARCEQIVIERRREAIETVVMAADQVEIQPVYYRGAKVGEYTRRDRTLGLYLLKQADGEALRAEQRREAAAFEARVQAEVERQVEERISKMSALGGHSGTRARGAAFSPANDLVPTKRTSPSRASVPHNVRKRHGTAGLQTRS